MIELKGLYYPIERPEEVEPVTEVRYGDYPYSANIPCFKITKHKVYVDENGFYHWKDAGKMVRIPKELSSKFTYYLKSRYKPII